MGTKKQGKGAAKKAAPDPLEAVLAEMREQGLPVQIGGFAVEATPTGISSFDVSTGIGGLPKKRITILQGEEASGKTLIALATIANVQRGGGRAAFVDAEHALTPGFAQLLGVDYDKLVISRPQTMDEAYDVFRPLCASGAFDVVVFDSAVALATEEEIGKQARQGGKRAGIAQVHADELRKVLSTINARTSAIIINQQRENPNPPSWWKGGKMLYSPGGRMLRHASSLTVTVARKQTYKNGTEPVGMRIKTYIEKNKVAQPYRRSEFDLMYATGLDLTTDLIDTGVEVGVVEKSSSWFYFDLFDDEGTVTEELKFLGKAAFEQALRDDVRIGACLQRAIAAAQSFDPDVETAEDDD